MSGVVDTRPETVIVNGENSVANQVASCLNLKS